MKSQKIIKLFMRCLKEIQNIINRLLYRDRVKTNNMRYKQLYRVYGYKGEFLGLIYGVSRDAFNYRRLEDGYNYLVTNIYKMVGPDMIYTKYKIPKKYF